MRLTIGNLVIAGRRIRERERSAGILARKPGELNPPYAGCRDAAHAEYRVGVVMVARWSRAPRQLNGRRERRAISPLLPRAKRVAGRGRRWGGVVRRTHC